MLHCWEGSAGYKRPGRQRREQVNDTPHTEFAPAMAEASYARASTTAVVKAQVGRRFAAWAVTFDGGLVGKVRSASAKPSMSGPLRPAHGYDTRQERHSSALSGLVWFHLPDKPLVAVHAPTHRDRRYGTTPCRPATPVYAHGRPISYTTGCTAPPIALHTCSPPLRSPCCRRIACRRAARGVVPRHV